MHKHALVGILLLIATVGSICNTCTNPEWAHITNTVPSSSYTTTSVFPGPGHISNESNIDLRLSSNSIGIKKAGTSRVYLVQCQWLDIAGGIHKEWLPPRLTLYNGAIILAVFEMTDFTQITNIPQSSTGAYLSLMISIPAAIPGANQYAGFTTSMFIVPVDLLIRYDIMINRVYGLD